MKIKTSELTGPALDYMVAKCEGDFLPDGGVMLQTWPYYSSDWAQGGPIIEREKINLILLPSPNYTSNKEWNYWAASTVTHSVTGPTPLIAAMRCYVASKLGDEIEVPDELL